jgi:hypothetical protein
MCSGGSDFVGSKRRPAKMVLQGQHYTINDAKFVSQV